MDELSPEDISNIHNIHNIHKNKMLSSDIILFIDTDFNGEEIYIGQDTKREELFVKSTNKNHIYLSSLINLYGKQFYDVLPFVLYDLVYKY